MAAEASFGPTGGRGAGWEQRSTGDCRLALVWGEGLRGLLCTLFMLCNFSVSFFSNVILYFSLVHLRASPSVCSLRSHDSMTLHGGKDRDVLNLSSVRARDCLCSALNGGA